MTGQTVSHFEIVEQLPSGRSGQIFIGKELVLGQTVRIRILHPEFGSDQDAFERFAREARSASALNHGNVARILEVGRGPSGTAINDARIYIVTHLQGAEAGGIVETIDRNPERAVEIARQVAEALSAVHELGLVHGALTPESISLSKAGNAVVADFGLSRLYEGEDVHPDVEAFRAPEVRSGQPASRAADLWSLGALLYTLISGAPPAADSVAEGRRPVLLQGVSSELVDLVAHLLDPDPDKRPTSARAAATAIQDLPEAAETQDKAVFIIPQSRYWSRMLLSAILVLLTVTAVWFATRQSTVSIDQRVLAIAPFEVESGTDLEFLSTGTADILAASLDSIGGWRTVGSDAVIGWTRRQTELSEHDLAISVAERFGAERVVTGSIRNDAVDGEITVTVYSRNGSVDSRIVVDADATEDLPDALVELARSIALELGIDPADASSDRSTHSYAALRSYLDGTEAIRRGSMTDAVDGFQSAVTLDPDFALAWSDLARAARFEQNHRLADEALGEAEKRSGQLPPTTRTLVRARDLAFRRGDPEGAAQLYETVLRNDSTNVAALSELGETLYRYNPRLGLSQAAAQPYFQRALTHSPDQTILVRRLSGISRDLDAPVEDSTTSALLAVNDGSDAVAAFITLASEMDLMDEADALLLATEQAGQMTRYLPGSTDFLRSLVAAAEGRLGDHADLTWRAGDMYRGARLVSEVMLYAHTIYPAPASKLEELRLRISQWDTLAHPVYMLDNEDVFEGRYRMLKPFLQGLVALRSSDDQTVALAIDDLSGIAEHDGARLAHSFVVTLRALRDARGEDYESALDLISQSELHESWGHMTKSQVYDQALGRYVKSEILFELGRYEESMRYSESLTVSRDFWGLAYLGPLRLRRAQTYALMGDRERAVDEFKRLLDLWSECDDSLIPAREEARVEMFRLLN